MEMKPIQGGGELRWWASPDKKYRHLFVRVNMECQPDHYPGIVIITDSRHQNSEIHEVKDLSRELDALLNQYSDEAVVYWDVEFNEEKRKIIMRELSSIPKFIDRE
jgi:hypothetical protein